MFWWVTVPSPMFGSHIDGARSRSRPGIEVEVALGVGDDAARRREQHRDVGERGERRVSEEPQTGRRDAAQRLAAARAEDAR